MIKIIRSDRRTLAVEIRPDGTVLVRAPRGLPQREIDRFLAEKQGWIQEKLALRRSAGDVVPLTETQLRNLAERMKEILPDLAADWAARVGVTYGRITIRNQATRWGSCSAQGNLNFNCLLMLAPPEILDYVIVHELCHRKHMDHSPAFWAEVARVLPDYKTRRKWLKDNGPRLMAAGARH